LQHPIEQLESWLADDLVEDDERSMACACNKNTLGRQGIEQRRKHKTQQMCAGYQASANAHLVAHAHGFRAAQFPAGSLHDRPLEDSSTYTASVLVESQSASRLGASSALAAVLGARR